MVTTAFTIAYTEKALGSLRGIPSGKIRRQIKAKIDGLTLNPHPAGVVKIQGTGMRKSVFRLR